MPTLLWLVDRELHEAVSRIEGGGGVPRFEELVDPEGLRRAHDDYARRRGEATVRTELAQPSGGVGGTRVGIKCLHAHLANFLARHDDPVGELVARDLDLPELVVHDVRG